MQRCHEDRAVGRVETEGGAGPGGANQWADQQQTTECCGDKCTHRRLSPIATDIGD